MLEGLRQTLKKAEEPPRTGNQNTQAKILHKCMIVWIGGILVILPEASTGWRENTDRFTQKHRQTHTKTQTHTPRQTHHLQVRHQAGLSFSATHVTARL
eukprot:scaffold462_cov195-Pinguiococcus_pyrenoidosus.AAC.87